jgi:hypothetical protein
MEWQVACCIVPFQAVWHRAGNRVSCTIGRKERPAG